MYSKINFIVQPNPGDTTLKIRNTAGVITNIIKELTCTIRQYGKFLKIKQSADSNLISLDFSSDNEATEAHSMLRAAIASLMVSTIIPQPNITSTQAYSTDFKYFSPSTATTADGQQVPGISPISDIVAGNMYVDVQLGGISLVVANGCNQAQFSNPQFHIVFAKVYGSFTYNTTSITILSTPLDFNVGDSVVLNDNGTLICRDIIAITGNVLTLSSPITGPITYVARTKKWGDIRQGDIPLWFGSFAGYQLDSNDVLAYKYITTIQA